MASAPLRHRGTNHVPALNRSLVLQAPVSVVSEAQVVRGHAINANLLFK